MQRYHNLDFLRAFAMLMGLVIHAPMLFWVPDFAKVFGIDNIAPAEEWVNVIGRFISSWRMPVFFTIRFFRNSRYRKKRHLTIPARSCDKSRFDMLSILIVI